MPVVETSANFNEPTTVEGENNKNFVEVHVEANSPIHEHVTQKSPTHQVHERDTPSCLEARLESVTDTLGKTCYRLSNVERPQPMAMKLAREAEGEVDLSSRTEVSSPVHRSKVVSPTSPPTPPLPTHHQTEEGSSALLLPNALVHHSLRQQKQQQQQQQSAEVVKVAGEEEPLSLLSEPLRSQSADHLPLIIRDTSSPDNRSPAIDSCLWSALCRTKSRQFDRAIRTLTEGSEISTPFLESTDAFLSLLQTKTESSHPTGVIAKTRRLRLTHICDTTIEESEERCPLNSPFGPDRYLEFTAAQHFLSSLTYENPLIETMNSALRSKRSQSYVAPSDFDYAYARQHHQPPQAFPRFPDVPPHGNPSAYTKHRSLTLSSVTRNNPSLQRHVENDPAFSSMWSPPPDKSTSAGLSPKHARIKSSPYNSRPTAGRENLTLSSSGFTLRQSAPSSSYSRVNRYSGGGMLDDYASGDSGGSSSSYRRRLLDQRKPVNANSSARMLEDVLMVRSEHDNNFANRSSTLPYKRRGSWHVDRETNFPTLDWNTSRNHWSKTRWRSFSPERLAVDTTYDVGPPAISSDTRGLRSQSLHNKHIRELTKSTDHLSTGFLDNYRGIENSFNTLRAKLDAASTQPLSFRRQASADRLYGRDPTAEQLRRQCEREHRRLLKSLMSDSWEQDVERQQNSQQQPYFNPTPGVVLPVQEATLLTAPRTTNPLTNPNLEKLLQNPALMQLLTNQASQINPPPDQNILADQVTLAAVAGAAAATAMANFTNQTTEQPSYSIPPVQATSTTSEYDWNDPETLMAAYTALAEASGGEKAFLEQLSPELAATLIHYREQLTEKLSSSAKANQTTSTVVTPSTATTLATTVAKPSIAGGNQTTVVLEDVSRQPLADAVDTVTNGIN